MKQLKIADIAEMAGVSTSTAARVISEKGYVSEAKRLAVEKVLKKVDYTPNIIAQELRSQRTSLIGHVVSSDYNNPYFAKIGTALDKASEENGYHLLTVFRQESAESEQKLVEELARRMVAGIIFTGGVASSPEYIEKLIKRGIPIIMIERPADVDGITKILLDNYEGSSNSAAHLIENGHRNIGFIGVQQSPMEEVEHHRYSGFIDKCRQMGIEENAIHTVFLNNYQREEGYEGIKKILKSKNPPSAVFVASDILASGALQYLYEKKIRVPDDISITSCDDSISDSLAPRLDSVSFPMEEIGRLAVNMILEQSINEQAVPKKIILGTKLIKKGSVAKIKF